MSHPTVVPSDKALEIMGEVIRFPFFRPEGEGIAFRSRKYTRGNIFAMRQTLLSFFAGIETCDSEALGFDMYTEISLELAFCLIAMRSTGAEVFQDVTFLSDSSPARLMREDRHAGW